MMKYYPKHLSNLLDIIICEAFVSPCTVYHSFLLCHLLFSSLMSYFFSFSFIVPFIYSCAALLIFHKYQMRKCSSEELFHCKLLFDMFSRELWEKSLVVLDDHKDRIHLKVMESGLFLPPRGRRSRYQAYILFIWNGEIQLMRIMQ